MPSQRHASRFTSAKIDDQCLTRRAHGSVTRRAESYFLGTIIEHVCIQNIAFLPVSFVFVTDHPLRHGSR
ncbi:hypothetical protein BC938DRAFT_471774 [Jimgerdemannia flammicorona]|uniref:Uncharacterized protein n=1 Tax=Jimgerdemannia flammicorona TaxID=994334 RepID=A0A433Q7G5_9FUNG|nr:hypothetical protein BC938DRAFT_471774 [Jimgerdemannia flammicorona]